MSRKPAASPKKSVGDLPATLDDFMNQSESDSSNPSESDQENSRPGSSRTKKNKLDLSARRQDIQKRIESLRERRRMASNQSSKGAFGLSSLSKENRSLSSAPPVSAVKSRFQYDHEFDDEMAASEQDDKPAASWLKPASAPSATSSQSVDVLVREDETDKPSSSKVDHRQDSKADVPNKDKQGFERRTIQLNDLATDDDLVEDDMQDQVTKSISSIDPEEAMVEYDLDTTEHDKEKFFEALQGVTNVQGKAIDYGELNRMLTDDDGQGIDKADDLENLDTVLEKAKETWLSELVDASPVDSIKSDEIITSPKAQPSSNQTELGHRVEPSVVSAVDTTTVPLGEDSYSMSFDSVSDLQDVSMGAGFHNQSITSDLVSLTANFDFVNNEVPLPQVVASSQLKSEPVEQSKLKTDVELRPPSDSLDEPSQLVQNSSSSAKSGEVGAIEPQRPGTTENKKPEENANDKIPDPQSHVSTPVPDFKDYFPSELSEISAKKDSQDEQSKSSSADIVNQTHNTNTQPPPRPLVEPEPNDQQEPPKLQVLSQKPLSTFGTSHLTFEDFLAMNAEPSQSTSTHAKPATSAKGALAKTSSTKSGPSKNTIKTETLKRVNEKATAKSRSSTPVTKQRPATRVKSPARKSQIPTPTSTAKTSRISLSSAPSKSTTSNLQVKIPSVSKESAKLSRGQFSEYEKMATSSYDPNVPSATTAVQSSVLVQAPSMTDILTTENSQLKEQIQQMQSQLSSLQMQLHDKIATLENSNEQIRFLEKQIEDERQSTSRMRLLNTQRQVGENATTSEAQLLKELSEQETLIRGYQTENEKLVTQLKTLRGQMKEQEQKHFFKEEALQREISLLRSQIELDPERQQQRGSDMTHAKFSVRIEQLEGEISSLKRQHLSREEGLKMKVTQLEAQLSEANEKLGMLQKSDPDHLKRLEAEKKALQDKYDGYIVELEGKLELLLEQSTYVKECQSVLEQYQELTLALEDTLQDYEAGKFSLQGSQASIALKGKSSIAGRKGTSSKEMTPTRFLRELEKQITAFKSIRLPSQFGMRGGNSSIATSHSRPQLEENDYIRHLKHRIKKLEGDMQRLNDEKDTLRREADEKIKEYQAKTDKELETIRSAQLTRQKAKAEISESQFEKEIIDIQQIKTLQLEIDQLRRQNEVLLASKPSEPFHPSNNNGEKSWAVLQKRVLEQEQLIDEYNNRLQSLSASKEKSERELSNQLAQKSDLIKKYEDRILDIQRHTRDKIFATEENKYLEQIHALKMDLDETKSRLSDTKSQLEVSERTREVVHETTITILKQAQEESSRLALAQHEKALQLLREELGVAGRHGREQTRDPADARLLERLEKRIEELEEANLNLQIQVRDSQTTHRKLMETEAQNHCLRKENASLAQSLELGKDGWPPALHHFDRLMKRIQQIEDMEQQRAATISQLISEPSLLAEGEIRREREKWMGILRSKDEEIAKFQRDLGILMKSFQKLKVRQGHQSQ